MSLTKCHEYMPLDVDGSTVTIYVYSGSYAEQFAKSKNMRIHILLTPEQEAEQKRQKEEVDRRQREEAQEQARKAAEEAERQRKAAEAAEQHRLAVLEEKRRYYDQLMTQIAEQNQIISENRGWFGVQAKNRKAAKLKLEALQIQLAHAFPNGRP